MPGPDTSAAPDPELAEAAFDARLAELGLALTPAERAAALRTARSLHRAAALLRAWSGADEPARP